MELKEFGSHWERKIRTLAIRFDSNYDGLITKEDYLLSCDRYDSQSHVTDEQKVRFRDVFGKRIWLEFFEDLSKLGPITSDRFVEGCRQRTKEGLKKLKEYLFPLFFQGIDTNSDGFISKQEFSDFYFVLGMDRSFAEAAFQAIDTNQDGGISCEEFCNALTDFFINEKPASTDIFFGPLI